MPLDVCELEIPCDECELRATCEALYDDGDRADEAHKEEGK